MTTIAQQDLYAVSTRLVEIEKHLNHFRALEKDLEVLKIAKNILQHSHEGLQMRFSNEMQLNKALRQDLATSKGQTEAANREIAQLREQVRQLSHDLSVTNETNLSLEARLFHQNRVVATQEAIIQKLNPVLKQLE